MPTRIRYRKLYPGLLALFVLLLGACRPVEAPTPTPGAEAQTPASEETEVISDLPLVGTSWTVASFGRPEDNLSVLEGTRLTLNFGVTRYAGDGGCNWFLGVYGADSSTLRLRTPAVTSAVCNGPGIMQQEATYLTILWNVMEYRKEGEQLFGYGVNNQIMLTFNPSETIELAGTVWTLRFLHSGRLMVPVNPATELTAQFADGQVSGSAGCNTFSGGYTLDGDQFAIAEVATTSMACAEPGVSQQEERFLTNLQAATRLVQTGGLLQLLSADGETLLAFGLN